MVDEITRCRAKRGQKDGNKELGVLFSSGSLAVIGVFVGFISGILYAVIGAIYDVLVTLEWITSTSTPGVGAGTALAFLAIIAMPITVAIPGFVTRAIGALLHNLLAG